MPQPVRVRYRDPENGDNVVRELEPGTRITFGRGPGNTVSYPDTETQVSRKALFLVAGAHGGVTVRTDQTAGHLRITAGDGSSRDVERQQPHGLGPGVHALVVNNNSKVVLRVEVEVPGTPTARTPLGNITVGQWSRADLMNPTPEEHWKLEAACALIADHIGGRKEDNMRLLVEAWHGSHWAANQHRRFDVIIEHLTIRRIDTGQTKLEAIASRVTLDQYIPDELYDAFYTELRNRALSHLNDTQLGRLGWQT